MTSKYLRRKTSKPLELVNAHIVSDIEKVPVALVKSEPQGKGKAVTSTKTAESEKKNTRKRKLDDDARKSKFVDKMEDKGGISTKPHDVSIQDSQCHDI